MDDKKSDVEVLKIQEVEFRIENASSRTVYVVMTILEEDDIDKLHITIYIQRTFPTHLQPNEYHILEPQKVLYKALTKNTSIDLTWQADSAQVQKIDSDEAKVIRIVSFNDDLTN